MFLETLSDETVALFKTNIPYGGSPEDMVKIYLLCGGLSYYKFKVLCTDVYFTKRQCV